MKKKIQNIELKIYELLGIKKFRKMAFFIRDNTQILFTLKMSKEERKNFLYHRASNYNLGKVKSLEDIKKFKKKLFLNAGVHIMGLWLCLPDFLKVFSGTAILKTTIVNLTFIVLNLYCILLQRYNGIRINQLIEKMTPRYEKQLDEIKEEVKKEDSLLGEHTYKIVNKKGKEKNVTLEELIDNATLEELKRYHKCLVYFTYNKQKHNSSNESDVRVSIKKDKTLKLELKQK